MQAEVKLYSLINYTKMSKLWFNGHVELVLVIVWVPTANTNVSCHSKIKSEYFLHDKKIHTVTVTDLMNITDYLEFTVKSGIITHIITN